MASRGDTIDRAIELNASPDVGGRLRDALAALPPPLAGEEEVVTRMREKLRDAIEVLEGIACGNVPRNAQHILKGIELMLRYTQPLPKQTLAVEGSIGIEVVDPFAIAPSDPVAPAVKAVGPVIRRKASESTVNVSGES